mmetsp:Transcript_119393/g.207277  ORF Transcript_119393/g.207277 Transcript_119393/m.207277 type:complete len:1032 (-) Transcript_119393:92-3187(-)
MSQVTMTSGFGEDVLVQGGWHDVVDTVRCAIVALKVRVVRPFQDDKAGVCAGTGFVVDSERGLVLTNRHVCTCSPQHSRATFVGHPAMEEIPVDVAYVDPTHDFAFLRYDPQSVKQTPVAHIALNPAGCYVGADIRVIGNDSNEKMQILSGTVARTDRNPPELDTDYVDENTFYALAATGTSGGSSGSPVINRQGEAVALNAAAVTGTMHGLFLPLHRVVRTLEALQRGAFVPRGTLHTRFDYISFPDCQRLGVHQEYVQTVVLGQEPPTGGTFTKAVPPSGMLKVKQCIRSSPASQVLQPGDVLLEVNGKPCHDFVLLDDVLDDSVAKDVQLSLCRAGRRVECTLNVHDLHGLIPNALVELGLGVFHDVSYHTAQAHYVPLNGVYVATPGFVFGEVMTADTVILSVNGVACNDLKTFEDMIQEIPDKEYFTITWMVPSCNKSRAGRTSYVKMQRQWGAPRAWSLDLHTRAWRPRRLRPAPAAALSQSSADEDSAGQVVPPPKKKAKKAEQSGAFTSLEESLCSVHFRTVQHFDMDVVTVDRQTPEIISRRGGGIIINAGEGFVLTDRGTVPQPLGDVEVMLGEQSRGASVWYMHPVHSFVVLRLDEPFSSGRSAVFDEHCALEAGDEVDFVGVDTDGRRFASQVKVKAVRLGEFPTHWPPRWCERNLEAVILVDDPPNTISGVLCNGHGRISALYSVVAAQEDGQPWQCGYGIPARIIRPLLEHMQGPEGKTVRPAVPSLEIELRKVELQTLCRLPLKLRPSKPWLEKLREAGSSVLCVVGITAQGPCDGVLKENDFVVAISGEVVTAVRELEAQLQAKAVAARGACSEGGTAAPIEVEMTIFRNGKKHEVKANVPLLGSDGSKRLLCWNGLLLSDMPRTVRQFGPVPAGVYIVETMLGSPAEADVVEGEFLVKVDGKPTKTLDDVIALSEGSTSAPSTPLPSSPESQPSPSTPEKQSLSCTNFAERRHLRLESADTKGQRFTTMVEPDPLFWPTWEMAQDQHGQWKCVECVQTPSSTELEASVAAVLAS